MSKDNIESNKTTTKSTSTNKSSQSQSSSKSTTSTSSSNTKANTQANKKSINKKPRKKRASANRTTITDKEQRLADAHLDGYTYAESYELAGYSCSSKGWTLQNKSAAAYKILQRPIIKEYVTKQKEERARKAGWSRDRAIKALIKVVEETPTLGYGGGNQVVSAIKEANKMCGYDKPMKASEVNTKAWQIPATMVGSAFVDLLRDIEDGDHQEYWLQGGRGSLKSSVIALVVLWLIENNSDMCACIIRNVYNTIGDSVYAGMKWAIEMANLEEEYDCIKSPFTITKKSTGQVIYFRGADDPGKIKSIKPPKNMYIGIQWMEEADQLKGMEEIRNIEQSLTRGGDKLYKFKSYNTPKSSLHFINVEKIIPKKNRLIHQSTYLDAPVKFLGKPFIDEAEYLKEVNPTAYAHEYMGEATGEDGMVFSNLNIREITKEEIESINTRLQGIDWGWYPDPFAWLDMRYKASTRTLYILDEYRANKMNNQSTYTELKKSKRINHNVQIIADSAEPKSIQDYTEYGAFIRPVAKFPGSVDYTMKWLSGLTEIVIDPKCKHTIKEFTKYELDKDSNGNYISVYPDKDNHFIDAARYGCMPIWKRRGE